MYISADEAFWNRSHVVDLITRVYTVCALQGRFVTWPLVSPEHAHEEYDLSQWGSTPVAAGLPVFGGVDENGGPEPPGSTRRGRKSWRIQVRALLFANPDTPCSVEEVANVLGIQEGKVRGVRPATAQYVGKALMAPFGHWLVSLRDAGILPTWTEEGEASNVVREPRRAPPARRHGGQLEPLGGPGRGGVPRRS